VRGKLAAGCPAQVPSPAKRERKGAKRQVRVENAERRALMGDRKDRRLPVPLTRRGFRRAVLSRFAGEGDPAPLFALRAHVSHAFEIGV